MTLLYLTGGIAVLSTVMVISRTNAVHALLYLIVSLLAVAMVFLLIGAPFAAALAVIIYAGAIMVLFVFVIMMLPGGMRAAKQEREWLRASGWFGPALLSAVLLGELTLLISGRGAGIEGMTDLGPKQVGIALYGAYFLGVELASLLLLAGLVGAYCLGRKDSGEKKEEEP